MYVMTTRQIVLLLAKAVELRYFVANNVPEVKEFMTFANFWNEAVTRPEKMAVVWCHDHHETGWMSDTFLVFSSKMGV